MKNWTQEEINYLKKYYKITLDRDLSKNLGRSLKAISYIACKLGLKKDKEFFAKARKRTNININKEILNKLYHEEKKSTRKIALEMGVGKTTIEYYLNKYDIPRRSHSEATKIYAKETNWMKGLTKNSDSRIKQLSENIKKTFERKRNERFKKIEEKYNMSFKEIISYFYWKKNLTQAQIAQKLGLSRNIIINLMKNFDISKRPNFEYIASLKGKNHPHYGKSWEELFGKEKAFRLKRKMSLSARRNIIRRLENNEMPFLNTQIEKSLAKELNKRKIPFKQQFAIDNKFVCDFAIPNFNIIIECDGDYWHANPKIYNINNLDKRQKENVKRDKLKDEYLIKKGWKLLRFFETDIKSSIDQCGNRIEKAIQQDYDAEPSLESNKFILEKT